MLTWLIARNTPSDPWVRASSHLGSLARTRVALRDIAVATAELDRARRYQRDVAVVVLQPHDAAGGPVEFRSSVSVGLQTHGIPPSPVDDVHINELALLLRGCVRHCDVAVRDPSDRWCAVLMPETGRIAAQLAVQRLGGVLARCHVVASIGLALFPSDGWTLEDLVSRATMPASAAVAADTAVQN